MSDAVARLRAKLEGANPVSEAKQSFPLWAYLHILEKSGDAGFNNYCKGAAVLYNWLTVGQHPIAYPEVPELRIPRALLSYTSFELAKIIAGTRERHNSVENYLAAIKKTELAIYYCNLTTRIPV